MGANRLFWPQEMLDQLIVDEKATIDDEVLSIDDDKLRYRVNQAVHFVADVGDGSDPHRLVGRVKELDALVEGGAEHLMDSVLLGDSAYQVIQGFSGEPLIDIRADAKGEDMAGAVAARAEDEEDGEDRELLAKFLLDNL
jgi:hypothetical protein